MRLFRAIAIAAAAGALVAGCGSSSGPSSNSGGSNGIANESASDILAAAVNAMKSARSVTLNGLQTSAPGQGVQINNGSFFSSGDVDAMITINGDSVHLIKIGSTDYMNASGDFWSKNGIPAADVSKLANVWVSVPDSLAHIGSELSLSTFANGFSNVGTVTKGGTSTVDGQAVVAVLSQNGTLYVATTGTPYPVQAAKTGTGGGTLDFSNWNNAAEPTVPAGAKTLAELGVGPLPGASGASGASGSIPTGSGSTGTTG